MIEDAKGVSGSGLVGAKAGYDEDTWQQVVDAFAESARGRAYCHARYGVASPADCATKYLELGGPLPVDVELLAPPSSTNYCPEDYGRPCERGCTGDCLRTLERIAVDGGARTAGAVTIERGHIPDVVSRPLL